jgi:hypothetical protein
VSYRKGNSGEHMEMDIAQAYPKQADAQSWNRTVRFNRGKDIVVVDSYLLNEPSKNIIENFIVAGKVNRSGPDRLILNDRENEVRMMLEYDSSKLSADIEPIRLKDSKLKQIWGDFLYRIRLKTKKQTNEDRLEFRFSKMK